MKQNKKKTGIATRVMAFVLLGAILAGAVVGTVAWVLASI